MELTFIDELKARLRPHPQLRVGVGDDAAILALADRQSAVITADLLAEGTHFISSDVSIPRIGRKALAVNLSDLAAMAAQPLAAVVSLLLPRDNALEIATELYDGILPLAEQFNVAIAGGDTNTWDGSLVISITAIGETTSRPSLRRSGAQIGDAIVVTGDLGGSRSGKQFDFTPRVAEALLLNHQYKLHAGIDVTDGLSLDLSRICTASGCGAMLDLDAIPISTAAKELFKQDPNGPTPLSRALGDGEDFELLVILPLDEAERLIAASPIAAGICIIGTIIDKPGVWQQSLEGELVLQTPLGYEH